MAYFLGIDGGGTKTRLLLGEEDRVLAEATVGGSNIVRLGLERVREALAKGIEEVCGVAQVLPERTTAVCAGVAGAARDSTRHDFEGILAALLPNAAIEVVGDMVIAHEGAFQGEPGVLVISGTGSIAYGRNAEGRTARAGGWGFAVSDEGSGHWIGVRAISAILRAHDAGETTQLEAAVRGHWGIASHDELVEQGNARPAPDFAALFPLVLRCFHNGDASAQEILVNAGTELAGIGRSVCLRLWQADETVGVKLSGSVFAQAAAVRQAFEVVLRDSVPNANIDLSQSDPAIGALARARRMRLTNTANQQA